MSMGCGGARALARRQGSSAGSRSSHAEEIGERNHAPPTWLSSLPPASCRPGSVWAGTACNHREACARDRGSKARSTCAPAKMRARLSSELLPTQGRRVELPPQPVRSSKLQSHAAHSATTWSRFLPVGRSVANSQITELGSTTMATAWTASHIGADEPSTPSSGRRCGRSFRTDFRVYADTRLGR